MRTKQAAFTTLIVWNKRLVLLRVVAEYKGSDSEQIQWCVYMPFTAPRINCNSLKPNRLPVTRHNKADTMNWWYVVYASIAARSVAFASWCRCVQQRQLTDVNMLRKRESWGRMGGWGCAECLYRKRHHLQQMRLDHDHICAVVCLWSCFKFSPSLILIRARPNCTRAFFNQIRLVRANKITQLRNFANILRPITEITQREH
jgi:hypothetical protein